MNKICKECNEEKPDTDFKPKGWICSECLIKHKNAYIKKWQKDNKLRVYARAKRWRDANKDTLRKYYLDNIDHIKEVQSVYHKKYYKEFGHELREWFKQYYNNNPSVKKYYNDFAKEYYIKNIERIKQYNRDRYREMAKDPEYRAKKNSYWKEYYAKNKKKLIEQRKNG
jgi:hypothetical protein